MRILFFVNSLSLGGAERVAANMATYYSNAGAHVAIATLSDKADFFATPPLVTRYRAPVSVLNCNSLKRTVSRIAFIRNTVIEFQPDVTIGIMFELSTLLGVSRFGLPGVFIGTEHSHPPFYRIGIARTIARVLAYGGLDATVSLTEETAIWHKKNTFSKLSIAIPNALRWPLVDVAPRLEVFDLKKPNQRMILAVGRLCSVKGFDRLILAFSKITELHPDWICVILGDGDERSKLEAQIKSLRLSDKIILAGRVGNLSDWYSLADLCVSTSYVEGFPNVLIEAMAHGVPCIAFDCDTGPRDIITSGLDGILVPNGNIELLCRAMRDLILDVSLKNSYGTEAIKVRERYSEQVIYSKWNDLFARLLKY